MAKDMRLVNIYIKIHNKKTLTMDDLAFLAKYNPECFNKTCKNLIYNMPESKPLIEDENKNKEAKAGGVEDVAETIQPEVNYEEEDNEALIRIFLDKLTRMEHNDLSVQNVDVGEVKDLMGNLYMEMMFPHNDRQSYFGMYDKDTKNDTKPTFNARA